MYKIKIKLTLDDVDSCNALVDIIRDLEDKLHDPKKVLLNFSSF